MLVKPLVRPIVRAIAGDPTATLGSGWSPTSLFSGGQQGYVYDLDDLSTVYLDSAGTTAASVNGLVGLVLDKSKGLARASTAELVTNGTFDTNTSGWTLSGGTATITQGAGGMTVASTVTAYVSQAITTVVGKNYRYSVEITANNAAAFLGIRKADDALVSTNIVDLRTSTNGVSVGWFRATSTTTYIVVQANTGASITVDNISLTEWYAGNHRYQTTTGSKPILRGSPAGGNLVTNGDFASGASWTPGAGWAIGSGVATATASSATLTSALTATASKNYRVTYTLTASAGSVQVSFGGRTGASRTASGTYVDYLDSTTTTAALVFTGTGFSGTVDNVEVVDVTAGSVVAPYSLQYDGVDDFLLTASVDFTATDKMTVCHGVRKLSDAATGVVASLGDLGATNGSFEFRAPWNAATANIGFGMRGNAGATSGATYTTFTAPSLNVFSFALDYALGAAAEISARSNGAGLTAAGTDSGAGPFANAPHYFGRRAGVSLPFNGLEYSSICVGKTASASELASIERWVNSKTRAY